MKGRRDKGGRQSAPQLSLDPCGGSHSTPGPGESIKHPFLVVHPDLVRQNWALEVWTDNCKGCHPLLPYSVQTPGWLETLEFPRELGTVLTHVWETQAPSSLDQL